MAVNRIRKIKHAEGAPISISYIINCVRTILHETWYKMLEKCYRAGVKSKKAKD